MSVSILTGAGHGYQEHLRLETEMGRLTAVGTALHAVLGHLRTRAADVIQMRGRDGALALSSLSPTGVVAATTLAGRIKYINTHSLETAGLSDPAVHYQDRERESRGIRLVDGKSGRLE